MGEWIAGVVGLCLALYGASDLLGRLCCYVLFADRNRRETLAMAVGDAHAEYRVRRLAAWRWLYPFAGFEVAVVTDSTEAAVVCEEVRLPVYTKKEWEKLYEIALQENESAV